MEASKVLNSIQESFQQAFEMFGSDVTIPDDQQVDLEQGRHEFIASIGLARSDVEVVVHLLFDRKAANYIVSLMLGEDEPDDEMAADGLGECANMTAGGVKSRTEGEEMILGLPSVITGDNVKVAACTRTTQQSFRFVVDDEFVVEGSFIIRVPAASRAKSLQEKVGEAQ